MKVKARKIHLSLWLGYRASGNLHDFVCKLIFTSYKGLRASGYFKIFPRSTGFKLGPDSREKWILPAGKLGRGDSQIGRSYSTK